MMGILLLVAACVVQGTAAGFLRGSASAIATSSTPLYLPAPEPITEPLIIGRVDAATEAYLRANRLKRDNEKDVKALIEAAPLLITKDVAMPLPDLQMCPLLPPSPPRLRHPLRFALSYRHASASWPLQMYPVVPYVGSAGELQALHLHAERIAKQPLDAGNCSARFTWMGV